MPVAKKKMGVGLCLFSATVMGGALQSTVAFAASAGVAAYRSTLSPIGRVYLDYDLARSGIFSNLANLCHLPTDSKDPQPQPPCHAPGLCGGDKRRANRDGAGWPSLLLD